MAISKIKTGSITDSAVDTNKLAPGSVGSTDLSATVISGQTELAETAADTDFTIIYDTSAGTLKKILRSNLKQAGPTISSISPTNASDTEVTATFTITGTGFTAGSNARFIDSNGKITEFDTVTRDSTTQITATIATSSLSGNNAPYDVQVTNGEGIASILTSQVNFNASPTFVTASGSLGTITTGQTGNFSVNATDPESAGNVTFELQSGSLPPGYSITNTAADGGTVIISGTDSTTSSTTTFNFVLRAVDAASNTSSRTFSITSAVPVSESFTSSGTFSVPSYATSVDVLVVAGGGSGSSAVPDGGAGAGGAGGLIFMPSYPVTPSGTITVTVGCGGASVTGDVNGNTGQDSVFGSPGDPGLGQGGVLTAKGGGAGGGTGAGGAGGSGGGGKSFPGNQPGGPGIQPTQPENSGAYGFGSNGGGGGACLSSQGQKTGGGGGGGAGGGGQAGHHNGGTPRGKGGDGGIGKAYTISDGTTPVYYAGGGGGTRGQPSLPGGAPDGVGGQGGGTNGNHQGNSQDGTANRGGGSGAVRGPSSSGAGGKGVVIVRY